MVPSKPLDYRIYLLTVWHEHGHDPPAVITWRFRLEDPRSGRQQAFADATGLMNALEAIAAAVNEVPKPEGGEE